MITAPAPSRRWLAYALGTTLLWGLWGALSSISIERGLPETLVYVVWAATMILPTIIVMTRSGWRLDRSGRAIRHGLMIGGLGAGGQLVLFYALTIGPAYLIFPIISLSPVLTIIASFALLGERTSRLGVAGIVLALVALPLFDFAPRGAGDSGLGWFVLALVVAGCWGVQAYLMKFAQTHMTAESIFFYMTASALALAPVAWAMTDWSRPVNWGWDGPPLAAAIQLLNAVGALLLVYAFRYGKAILVAPLTNAGAPLITALLALAIAGVVPAPLKAIALVMAVVAAALLAFASEPEAIPA